MRILVTGASGGLGRFLVDRLLGEDGLGREAPFERLTLMARRAEDLPRGERIRIVAGDLRDPAARAKALEGGVDLVFHFAASLAAEAEREFDLGRTINIDASLSLLNELRNAGKPPRVVYPSSIGVYGDALGRPVDDDTMPRPNISYGAAKLINEVYISDLTRRGDIDGVSLRLPACLPRPRMPDLTPSPDFASSVFHALKAGHRFMFPVSANAAMWFLSAPACMDAVLHAARLPASAYGSRRAFMLPALWLTTGQLVDALAAALGPGTRERVSWSPQPGVEEVFARFPALTTPFADGLGFRHDGGIEALVSRTLSTIA
jgi:nucleoside-diphosphate-sugar epimerase